MMVKARFISVGISTLAMAVAILIGFPSCHEVSAPTFDEATALYPTVSGEKAFAHVEALVGFGPRPAGSEALEQSRGYLTEQLEGLGWSVQRQPSEQMTPDGKVEFVNLIARFGESPWERQPPGLLCTHIDTKKFSFEFVGANDSGSSTGLVLEMARALAQRPSLAQQIELVFFDGEEAFGPNITGKDGLYGSRHYAQQMVLLPEKKRPKWGVLLDMVGDKDLNVRAAVQLKGQTIRELKKAQEDGLRIDIEKVQSELGEMAKHLMAAADQLDVRQQIGVSSDMIIDDHIPLNVSAGIPTIDLIDFDYGSNWHTPGDTLDKISAESLETVGQVTMLLIERYLTQ